ncbi:hypothetical protein JIN85_14680 [Luteolibacter pohnpeiensis]|uniref:Uncharacterized protein n=1 Tax=Luteolibacter pohnpeiensis TaxID=454153 RepID=A0A934S9E8_9BACT|nr:hypothetical protein [Luteolibacter pohnpeiensis]MBK1883664.1 hypothetical protein [Luteolibacter pohnpeiensis]
MPNNDQAEADLELETTGDPSSTGDETHDPNNGATDPIADYQKSVDRFRDEPDDEPSHDEATELEEQGEEEEEQPEEPDSEGEEQEAETEESEPESDEEEEEPESEDPKAKSNRFRLRAKDEVEAEAFEIRKRHPEWSLKECISKAESILGVQEKSESKEVEQAPSRTAADVTSEITDLRAQKRAATIEMDFEKAAELEEKIDNLFDERDTLRAQEAQRESSKRQEEVSRYDREFAESEARTTRYYPDTKNPESPLFKKMQEIDREMQEMGDPVFDSPDKPFILAKAAAKELGIMMTNPAKTPKVAAVPAKKNATRRPNQIASGSARSTPPTAPATKLEEQMGKIKSLDDYERFVGTAVD